MPGYIAAFVAQKPTPLPLGIQDYRPSRGQRPKFERRFTCLGPYLNPGTVLSQDMTRQIPRSKIAGLSVQRSTPTPVDCRALRSRRQNTTMGDILRTMVGRARC
jgi:hypothetical protein